jgi:hypothetical protein
LTRRRKGGEFGDRAHARLIDELKTAMETNLKRNLVTHLRLMKNVMAAQHRALTIFTIFARNSTGPILKSTPGWSPVAVASGSRFLRTTNARTLAIGRGEMKAEPPPCDE